MSILYNRCSVLQENAIGSFKVLCVIWWKKKQMWKYVQCISPVLIRKFYHKFCSTHSYYNKAYISLPDSYTIVFTNGDANLGNTLLQFQDKSAIYF